MQQFTLDIIAIIAEIKNTPDTLRYSEIFSKQITEKWKTLITNIKDDNVEKVFPHFP
jgi:hypothetical protein